MTGNKHLKTYGDHTHPTKGKTGAKCKNGDKNMSQSPAVRQPTKNVRIYFFSFFRILTYFGNLSLYHLKYLFKYQRVQKVKSVGALFSCCVGTTIRKRTIRKIIRAKGRESFKKKETPPESQVVRHTASTTRQNKRPKRALSVLVSSSAPSSFSTVVYVYYP